MASEQNNRGNSELTYMSLSEFTEVKNEKKYLKNYTRLDGIKACFAQSLLKNIHQEDAISNTKMTKALSNYFRTQYNSFFHKKQIQEFLSEDGFSNTPEEQRKVFEDNRENIEFVKLMQKIYNFYAKTLKEEENSELYIFLTK